MALFFSSSQKLFANCQIFSCIPTFLLRLMNYFQDEDIYTFLFAQTHVKQKFLNQILLYIAYLISELFDFSSNMIEMITFLSYSDISGKMYKKEKEISSFFWWKEKMDDDDFCIIVFVWSENENRKEWRLTTTRDGLQQRDYN